MEISVATTTAGAEAVSEILCGAGCAGTVVKDPYDVVRLRRRREDWDFIDEDLAAGDGGEVTVTGYLPANAEASGRMAWIRAALSSLRPMEPGFDPGSCRVRTKTVSDEDWALNWRKYYHPFPVGEKLYVSPVWIEEPPPAGRLPIRINPGMAFGTGTHETTAMCLELLELVVNPGDRVADVGCGSGILGIAALCLGAERVLAIDRDPVCVTAAVENKGYHPRAGRMEVRLGDLLADVDETFDVIAANIIAGVIIGFAPDAFARLRPGGALVASGILLEQAVGVTDALTALGFAVENGPEKGGMGGDAARKP
jgi:ribosomal protein L11 methyltransferase